MSRNWILYVEDNEIDVRVVRNLLPQSKYPVTWAASGAEATEKLKTTTFDLILLDHGLPDTNGLALLEEIRKKYPATPVIILTGRNDDALAVSSLKKGAAHHLMKDAMHSKLLSTVEATLESYDLSVQDRLSTMERAERLHETLLTVMTEGVLLVDVRGEVTFANEAMGRMADATASSLLGHPAVDLFDPSTRILFQEWMRPFQSGTANSGTPEAERSAPWEGRLRRKVTSLGDDGTELIHVLVTGRSVTDKLGQHEACLVTLADISELVLTRQRLQQRLAEMERFQRFFFDRESVIIDLKTKLRDYERRLGIERPALSDETLQKLQECLREREGPAPRREGPAPWRKSSAACKSPVS